MGLNSKSWHQSGCQTAGLSLSQRIRIAAAGGAAAEAIACCNSSSSHAAAADLAPLTSSAATGRRMDDAQRHDPVSNQLAEPRCDSYVRRFNVKG